VVIGKVTVTATEEQSLTGEMLPDVGILYDNPAIRHIHVPEEHMSPDLGELDIDEDWQHSCGLLLGRRFGAR